MTLSSLRVQSRVSNPNGIAEPGKTPVLQGCCQLAVDPDRGCGVVERGGADLDRACPGSDELQRIVAGAHSPDPDDGGGRDTTVEHRRMNLPDGTHCYGADRRP